MPVRKIIEIDEDKCDGCGQCVLACAEGALKIVDGKAKVISEAFCDGLGACMGDCPRDALRIVERESSAFDEEAVKDHLKSQGHTGIENVAHDHSSEAPCGCPSSEPMVVRKITQLGSMGDESDRSHTPSELTNWPVQWKLIQPGSAFYKNADILVAADCVPFAFGGFHKRFLKGKPMVIGCPKLDDQGAYLAKLTALFQEAAPKSVHVVVMEVPCCNSLMRMVTEAMKRAGRTAPVNVTVVGIDGKVI
ncbi:MAG: 4Fe-4S dicluster domain-containing protein [Methanomassiliicoccus sp.]|nr:MAG: 4Fe-4S dicluster domain-containing protein [Methanomassiliicoccus sp.]